MDEDLGRYRSAAGWDPDKKFRRGLDKARRDLELEVRWSQPILRLAGEEGPPLPPAGEELFATLWRTGEVALLYGEPGVGKSIFAAHLAESITTSDVHDWTAGIPACEILPRRLAYIDLQRTDTQWRRGFPNPSFQPLHLDWNQLHPDETDNDRAKRIHTSIYRAIEDGTEVVILDDITLGGINIGCPNGPFRTLRTLKKFAAENGTSFLVVAGARPRKRRRPASLSDVAFRHIAEQADSVFCLSASTYGPAFRYIRHLRSASSPLVHDGGSVLTFHFESGGFKYLGECEESEHLRDYAAEARALETRERAKRRRLNTRSARTAMIEGYFDGSFHRYLNGK